MILRRLLALVVCGAVLMATCVAMSQDWPQWRGPARDGVVKGFAAPAAWPQELSKQWTVEVGAGDASPALVDGKLYVFSRQGAEEVLICLDAESGKEAWKTGYAAPAVEGGPARTHPGPRSSPTVAEGKVLTLGVSGILTCFDAASGKVAWQKEPFPGVVPQFFTGSSPIIVDGLAVAHLGGAGNGALIAYDLGSGDEKWRWGGEGPDYGSPVVMDLGGTKQVVTLTASSVVGVAAADGKLLWSVPFPIARMSMNAATPVVHGDMVIFSAAGRGCHAVKIEKSEPGFSATELWSNPDGATKFNTATLKDGKLYGMSDAGNLFCIDAATGKTLWVDAEKADRMGFGAIVDLGSVLMALPSNGELVAYQPKADGYAEVARFKVADSATYAHPILSGKHIFIKDEASVSSYGLQ